MEFLVATGSTGEVIEQRLPAPRIAGIDAARTSLATYRFARLPSRQYFAARVEVDLRDLNGHGGRLNRSVGEDGAHNCKI